MNKITLAFLALLPFSAFSQPVDPCIAKNSTQEMSACAKAEYQQTSDRLDKTYKALIAQMPKKDVQGIPYQAVKKQFPVAQHAWVEFVAQDCQTISIYNKGSLLRDIEYYSCMRLHTEQRISDLERFLSRREKPKS